MGRSIRPVLDQNKPKGSSTIPIEGVPPFDAEAHYKDYDHEAVRELSRKTLLCPATYNRKGTVEVCMAETYRNILDAKMYIHDDGSDEYDAEWLGQFCDRVCVHPRSCGGKRGVKNVRSNIVKSILGMPLTDMKKKEYGSEINNWVKEDFGPEGPEYLYMVDSDGMHDPHFFYRLHEIMELGPNWGVICLYSAKFHAPRRNRAEVNPLDYHTTVRGMAAGISMFFRVESFRANEAKVQVPDGRGWDGYYSQTFGARKVVQSLVSYVEHLGKWGFHNKGNFDRDRALNPTQYLASKRGAAIKKIEATFIETQKDVAKQRRKEQAEVKS